MMATNGPRTAMNIVTMTTSLPKLALDRLLSLDDGTFLETDQRGSLALCVGDRGGDREGDCFLLLPDLGVSRSMSRTKRSHLPSPLAILLPPSCSFHQQGAEKLQVRDMQDIRSRMQEVVPGGRVPDELPDQLLTRSILKGDIEGREVFMTVLEDDWHYSSEGRG